MRADFKEEIRGILNQYGKIVLAQENDAHFGTVFRAGTKKYASQVVSLENIRGGV